MGADDESEAIHRSAVNRAVKILYLESSWDATVGGSHISLLHLVTGMKGRGYEPVVVFRAPHDLMDRFTRLGIRVHLIPMREPFRVKKSLLRPAARVFNFLASTLYSARMIVRFRTLLKLEHVQIVHLNNSVASGYECLAAAKLLRLPCLTHERGFPSYSISARYFARYFDVVICISEAVRRNLVAQGLCGLKLRTIHNGLDVTAFRAVRDVGEVRRELGLERSRPVVGIVGNIQSWKGQDVVIRAVAIVRKTVPNIACLIIGDVAKRYPWDVAYFELLQRLIRDEALEKNVVLTGYRRDVATYMNALDIVVHASVDPEPFGRVLLEAMALGKPLIAVSAGGVPEIVNDTSTGLLYPPGDTVALAAGILNLLSDADKRSAIGRAAYNRVVADFNIEKNTAQTEAIYRSILAKKP